MRQPRSSNPFGDYNTTKELFNVDPIINCAHQALRTIYTGYCPGDLYVVVGHSGADKTSLFVTEVAKALKDGCSVAVWTSPDSTNVDKQNSGTDWNQLSGFREKTGQLTLLELDELDVVHHIRLQAVKLKHQGALDLMVIDSFDLEYLDETPEQYEATLLMAYSLKRLAWKLNVPLIIICSLGNAAKQVDLYGPVTEQYYNSDPFILQANVVMFCYQHDLSSDLNLGHQELTMRIDKNETGKEYRIRFRLLDPDSV